MTVVSMTKTTADRAPARRLRANATVLLRLPLGSKDAPGTGVSTTPVKLVSNSSNGTLTAPRAGSFM